MGIFFELKCYAGTDIDDACNELVRFATRLGVDVWTDFNGIRVLARPEDNPVELAKAYRGQLQSDRQYKIASTPVQRFYQDLESTSSGGKGGLK